MLANLIAESPHNLVAASERPYVFTNHIVESLGVADALAPAGRWMDLGTGGGLPGLVLAERHPAVHWTLVDATAKKVAAVREFAAAMGLPNVTVVHARAEALAWESAHRGRYAGVVARAVAPLPTLLELARGFLAADGVLAAIKGPAWQNELDAAAGAARTLGYEHLHSRQVSGGVRDAWLVTMQVHGPPPAGFPRRDGLPKHEPLR